MDRLPMETGPREVSPDVTDIMDTGRGQGGGGGWGEWSQPGLCVKQISSG